MARKWTVLHVCPVFVLLVVLLLTGRVKGIYLNVQVNYEEDQEVNSTACSSEVSLGSDNDGNCSLRSAVALCAERMSTEEDSCYVNITVGNVSISSSFGEIYFGTKGALSIDGNGATIQGDGAGRLLNITGPAGARTSFSMSNAMCQGFGDNKEDTSLLGGLFYIDQLSEITLERLTFVGSHARDGGAVFLARSTSLVIADSIFDGNFASRNGGALAFGSDVSDINVSKCSFMNNHALHDGGGIFMGQEISNSVLSEVYYYRNTAGDDGGAIFLDRNNKNILFSSNIISNNTASWDGGGMKLNLANSNITFFSCQFIFNTVTEDDGGGVYLREYNRDVQFVNSTFEYNKAIVDNGGGLYLWQRNYNITLLRNNFRFNYAQDNGGAIYVFANNQYLLMSDCVFFENAGDVYGGVGILQDNKNIVFDGIFFIQNKANLYGAGLGFNERNEDVTLKDCQFLDNIAIFDGGAINFYLRNSKIHMSGCKFIRNAGEEGAAIMLYEENSLIYFENCLFARNLATASGGALYLFSGNHFVSIIESQFTENIALFGGAIYLEENNNDISLERSDVVGNVADVQSGFSDGGGVYILTSNARVTMRQCLIRNNSATFEGGGLYINSYNDNITIADSIIEDNHAKSSGGGVYVFSYNDNLVLDNVTFSKNFAKTSGGGLVVYDGNRDWTISNSCFSNNTSGDDGGAFYMSEANLRLKFINVLFEYNTAFGEGGGGFIWQFNQFISFIKCLIFENVAVFNGGGVYFYRFNHYANVISTNFRENSADSDDGGGLFLKLGNEFSTVSNCTFMQNTAGTSGGGISLRSSNRHFTVEHSVFSNNHAAVQGGGLHSHMENLELVLTNLSFSGNKADDGGGLYLGNFHVGFSLQNSQFSWNKADRGGAAFLGWFIEKLFISNCVFMHNEATSAGALLVRSIDISLLNTLFHDNKAGDAAAAYINSERGVIGNCTVRGNTATSAFGGITIDLSENITVYNVVFEDNLALLSGGGLSILSSANILVLNSLFMNNTADGGGGLFIIDNTNISIVQSAFLSCASGRGGGAKIMYTAFSLIESSVFENNAARDSGGAIHISDSTYELTMSKNLFVGNVAHRGHGSAMIIFASLTKILNSTFVNNSVVSGGGTVYWVTYGMDEPEGLRDESNEFQSNTAMYGTSWATQGFAIHAPTRFFFIVDYYRPVPPVAAHLVDYYNQTVTTDSTAHGEVKSSQEETCDSSVGFVSGGLLTILKEGVANFTSVLATCAPGHNMTLEIAFEEALFVNIEVGFRSCVRGEFYQDGICQPCPLGSFGLLQSADLSKLSQSNVCRRCPDEASRCYSDVIELNEGYWRSDDSNDYILECPLHKESCNGGSQTNEESCSEGYHGPLCAVCDDNYHFSSLTQTCELCSDEVSWIGPLAISCAVVLVLCVLGGIANRIKREVGAETFNDVILHFLIRWGHVRDVEFNKAKKVWITEYIRLRVIKRMQVRLRIYVTFYQILEILPFVLDLSFPAFYNVIASIMSLVNLDLSTDTLSAGDCSGVYRDYDYIDKLIFSTIYPLVLVACVQLLCRMHVRYKAKSSHLSFEALEVQSIASNYQKACLVFISLILPSISSIIFATFSCTDVDSAKHDGEEVYMTVDYSISCYSSRYYFAFAWALLMVGVYPIGIPFCYFMLLRKHKKVIVSRDVHASNKNPKLEGIKFLYEIYKPKFWYWEVVEMLYRLSVTGLLVLFDQGSILQIVVGLFFSLAFVKLYDLYLPFVDKQIKAVKEVSLWQIYFLFFFAFGIKTKMLGGASDSLIVFLLFIIIFFNIIFDVSKFLLFYFGMHQEKHIIGSDKDSAVLQMSAEELDNEISLAQGRVSELTAIKEQRLQSIWSSANKKTIVVSEDAVKSPMMECEMVSKHES